MSRVVPITLAGQPRPKAERQDWSVEDGRVLAALASLGIVELRKRFPDRTTHAIRARARLLGITIAKLPYCKEYIRGKHPIPKKCHPLVRRLYGEMNRQGVFLYELSERSGVTRQAISRWRYSCNPSLTGLIAAFNVLGMDLQPVHQREESEAA